MEIRDELILEVLEEQIPEGFFCKSDHFICPYYQEKKGYCFLLEEKIKDHNKVCDINI
jgi:hypothetical protein